MYQTKSENNPNYLKLFLQIIIFFFFLSFRREDHRLHQLGYHRVYHEMSMGFEHHCGPNYGLQRAPSLG